MKIIKKMTDKCIQRLKHITIHKKDNCQQCNDDICNKKSKCMFIRKIAALISLVLSALCFIFWIACLCFAGAGISELWIWPAASIFFCLWSFWTAEKKPFSRLHRKKWLRVTVALTLAILICFFGFIECFIISGMNDDGQPDLDYIIVLGAQVRGTVPSSALQWRIERAYEYLAQNPDTFVVVSGGQGDGEDISEAECMRRELVEMGIPNERILIEDKSTSTKENVSFSLEIIGNKNAAIGIVTNNFHVWRAVKIAQHAGAVNVCGISAPFRNLLVIHYMAREFFSVVANSLNGNM